MSHTLILKNHQSQTYKLHIFSTTSCPPRTLPSEINKDINTKYNPDTLFENTLEDGSIKPVFTSLPWAVVFAISGPNKNLLVREAMKQDRKDGRGSEVLGWATTSGKDGWMWMIRVWDWHAAEKWRKRGLFDIAAEIRDIRGIMTESGSSTGGGQASTRGEVSQGREDSTQPATPRGNEQRRPQPSSATALITGHWRRSEGRWGFDGMRY